MPGLLDCLHTEGVLCHMLDADSTEATEVEASCSHDACVISDGSCWLNRAHFLLPSLVLLHPRKAEVAE